MSLCPVPSGAAQNYSAAFMSASAIMTHLATGDLSVRSFEAYIRDFTFVWLIPLSGWASARRSPSAQPTFLPACRFRCRTVSFHSVSSAELRLAHHAAILLLVFCFGQSVFYRKTPKGYRIFFLPFLNSEWQSVKNG